MLVEGKGLVAPIPVRVPVPCQHRKIILDWIIHELRPLRCYGERRDSWGKGLTSDFPLWDGRILPSSEAGAYAGKVGEWALAILLNRRLGDRAVKLDLELRLKGDGGKDLEVCNRFIDVKTRLRQDLPLLIRRNHPSGELVPLRSDIYVSAFYSHSDQEHVSLLGWTTCKKLASMKAVPARRGDHRNIEVPDCDLNSIGSLVSELRGLRGY